MMATSRKRQFIYLQIILFLLGSFTPLVQNAMAASCHMLQSGMMMKVSQKNVAAMDEADSATAGQMHDKCCDDCNCSGQNCNIGCSMLSSLAAGMSMPEQYFPLSGAKPPVSIPVLVGISDLPEHRPPRFYVL